MRLGSKIAVNKTHWMLLGVALFSACWLLVAPNLVRKFGDPEVAGWVPFWMIPASLVELIVWALAMCWPRRGTVILFGLVAFAQFMIGCGVFPK
jgi:hypothetical protein